MSPVSTVKFFFIFFQGHHPGTFRDVSIICTSLYYIISHTDPKSLPRNHSKLNFFSNVFFDHQRLILAPSHAGRRQRKSECRSWRKRSVHVRWDASILHIFHGKMQAGVDFVTVRGPQNVWKVYLVWMT